MQDAWDTVRQLASSRRSQRTERQAASCGEVISLSNQLTDLVKDFPASPFIRGIAGTVSSSQAVICSPAERQSLASLDAKFNESLTELTIAIEAVQDQLRTLTGTTASIQVLGQAQAFPSLTEKVDRVHVIMSLTFEYFLICR